MLDYFNEKDDGSPQVFMGDINAGPAFPEFNIIADFEENYQEIVDDGFMNPNADSATPFCTFCRSENLLNSQ